MISAISSAYTTKRPLTFIASQRSHSSRLADKLPRLVMCLPERRFFRGVEVQGRSGVKDASTLLPEISLYLPRTASCASRNGLGCSATIPEPRPGECECRRVATGKALHTVA